MIGLLFIVLLAAAPAAAQTNSNLFREYISGNYGLSARFTDVPINSGVQFHFILAFAIDSTTQYVNPTPTNGVFNPFWNTTTLTPSAVLAVKQQHPNVKVGLSLGGYNLPNGSKVSFTATSVSSWVANAVSSLTALIRTYHLDGVDVDYENFASGTSTFVDCIGQTITQLKNNGVISFASIAPFDDQGDEQTNYHALWSKYSSVIDYINYQFYAYPASTTAAQYVAYYNTQISSYSGGKVLASFATYGANTGPPPSTVLSAMRTLRSQGKLFGIFVFWADSSKSGGSFQYETQAQQLLATGQQTADVQ